MSFFTTFGSFSIAAGILLIFLIFVMLAAERRGELGIARAVGTRRGHLVQMFLFEGLAYDLLAAAVGAAARLGRRLRDGARDGARVRAAERLRRSRTPSSRRASSLGYAIGVLLTLRRRRVLGLAREPDEHRDRDPQPARAAASRRRAGAAGCSASLGLLVGAALAVVRASARKDAVVLGLGVSLVILSLVPILRAARPARAGRAHRRRARARRSGSCCRSAAGSSAT